MRKSIRAAGRLSAAVALAVTTACLSTPEGVGGNRLGGVDITVVDQNGAPVNAPNVVIQEMSGSTLVQQQSGIATSGGVIHFESVQEATLQAWADPPAGYSGGGSANAVTFNALAGIDVDVKLTLTKNP
jgi:hypothetical protein